MHVTPRKQDVESCDRVGLASGSQDGTIRLWDAEGGTELAALCALDGGRDYLTATPGGYYACSPEGAGKTAWRINNQVYLCSQFSERFDRPDLVGKALAREDISGAAALDATLIPPRLVFLSPRYSAAVTDSEVKVELRDSDAGVRIETSAATADRMLDDASTRTVVRLSHVLPNGMVAKSLIFEKLVTASINVGVVTTEADRVLFDISVRSGEDSVGDYLSGVIADITEACGGTSTRTKGYPAFPYSPESPLRKLALDVYKEVTGKDGAAVCIHGGTETGVVQRLCPGIDTIGLGPTGGDGHTPREWVDLASFARMFEFLVTLLGRLTKE
jgi:acetylornithine deacetylase/succinyl-diaminopimelate desuccinylase-like protein